MLCGGGKGEYFLQTGSLIWTVDFVQSLMPRSAYDLSDKKANIITKGLPIRKFSRSVFMRELYTGTPSLHSYIEQINEFRQFTFVKLHVTPKMFRLFFLMVLAIFLTVSFGTSQNNSSNQVTSQRSEKVSV